MNPTIDDLQVCSICSHVSDDACECATCHEFFCPDCPASACRCDKADRILDGLGIRFRVLRHDLSVFEDRAMMGDTMSAAEQKRMRLLSGMCACVREEIDERWIHLDEQAA